MATLYKHGEQLATRETTGGRIAVMSDGNILRNQGQGWKLYKRTKPGVDPAEYARKFDERTRAIIPEVRAYIEALKDAVDLSHRWMLHEAISVMPTDPDGCWSTLDDYGYTPDLDDICKACRLYLIAESAAKEADAAGKVA
jgi:hypothetical protein